MKAAVACVFTLLPGAFAWSLDPTLSLQQLNHRAFTEVQGAPGNVRALAQTTDGTLWGGGETGLFRFDGVRFVSYPGPADEPLPSTNISALLASPDGGLWIGFGFGGVNRLQAGHLTRYDDRDGLPDGSVWQFALDHEGTLWMVGTGGLARLRGQRWERVAGDTITSASSISVDRAGTLWVMTPDRVLARASGESGFREIAIRNEGNLDVHPRTVAEAPDGSTWGAAPQTVGAISRLSLGGRTRPTDRVTLLVPDGFSPYLFDDDGNLWLSGPTLQRATAHELSRDRSAGDLVIHTDKFGPANGLSGTSILPLLQDREKNIWVSTRKGLDRFSRGNVVPSQIPLCSGPGYAIAAGDGGALWAACAKNDTTEGDVLEIRDGIVVSQRPTGRFTAAYRDRDGSVWFAGASLVGQLKDGKILTTPLPEEARGQEAQAIARDSSGAIWVSVVHRGVFRFSGGRWSAYGGLDAFPQGAAIVETADSEGVLWFGYPGNRVARLENGALKVFDTSNGLQVGNVTAIAVHDKHVWIGGELGFARFDGVRFVPVRRASGRPFSGISGIVNAKNGDLWLNAIGGISHIPREEVERVDRDAEHRVQDEVFDSFDGASGYPMQMRPIPSAVETTDGHIWFCLYEGMVWVDAAHLNRNLLPPPVTIWTISSGQQLYRNLGEELHLPKHTTNLQIDYTAGSLVNPERIRFRYKLEGSDRVWQDVGNRREALYTNLGPGPYTFRVTAANSDGVWNDTGASIKFSIDPAFYQTRWFYALCALMGLGVLAALYRLRMRQVAARVRSRFEERLSERERIARELHDTLLQSVQGLIWRFQAVADRLPLGDPERQRTELALERADQVLGESRDRVKDLRSSESSVTELPRALASEGEQLAAAHGAQFQTSVEGLPRELHPIAREEAFLIAREALGNAFRHAGAQHIEVQVVYDETALSVRIRDDGRGIGPEVLQAGGAPGHFGLLGMRERVAKLKAHLDIWSKLGAGTEIDLRIPGRVAYRERRPSAWRAGFWRGEGAK
jgi:signal transduction histidine kinase/ligand-binding sensor domain-containing protein